ncbi:TniQ family protein [uncultured Roseobacter sp.]|uniref:TniQ family protein n=1 Tax=uncultured Roseobacter sp. TaxID=114847 RepID=UPI0026152064|nr:TniQ family protein [uncultured Roseobacter sp.]
MTGHGRLPVVFPPEPDERLSSWIARLVPIYAMTVPEFLSALGLPGRDIFDLEWRLMEGEGPLVGARTGLSSEALQAMTFRDLMPDARMLIARRHGRRCPACASDIHLKTTALPWVFRCQVHGTDLQDAAGGTLADTLGVEVMATLEAPAKVGASLLEAWSSGEEQNGFGPVEMLALLTALHRRASPPSVTEQPRMPLGARRHYHEFLTAPITRQALPVVVPEYDRVAPVLTKPVLPGLHGLAQGSLLKSFALTVGIGRIAEDPVARAIDVLLAGDTDGQVRVRAALSLWPLSLRRRISARFWRAERDERDRQVAEKAAKRRQSHKYRRVQSHQYRSRIS